MPWKIEQRDGRYCVVKEDDGDVEGCHDTRAEAVKQQRALYANEPSMGASLEIDTTALMEEFFPDPDPQPIKIEVGAAPNEANAALVAALAALTERLERSQNEQQSMVEKLQSLTETDRERFTAALEALTAALSTPPTVNVTTPETTVNVPEQTTEVTVPAPTVNVNLPSPRRHITIERDPFGVITGATVEDTV